MTLKKTDTIELAAAKAGFSRATGYRPAADPSPPCRESKPRGRRRPDPLADIFDTEVVPILENSPGIRPVGVFEELMRRHPELGPGVCEPRGAGPCLSDSSPGASSTSRPVDIAPLDQ